MTQRDLLEQTMGITAATLIALYIIAILIVINWPQRQHHPEDRIAKGCLFGIVMGLAALGLVLGIAWWLQWRGVVNTIFVITLFPAIIAGPQLAWLGIKTFKHRSAAKGKRIPPDQLNQRLSGYTHVSHYGTQDPPREWNELRYYSPDGRVFDFREESGQIWLIPGDVTWEIEGNLFVTLNDIRPGNRNCYMLKETSDGQIAYYIHAPMSRLNGQLSRRTVAIRAGEPLATRTVARRTE